MIKNSPVPNIRGRQDQFWLQVRLFYVMIFGKYLPRVCQILTYNQKLGLVVFRLESYLQITYFERVRFLTI